jgi:hypothetical protein
MLLFSSATRPAFDRVSVNLAKVEVLPTSALYLKGSSNVNKFTCDCEQEFPPVEVDLAMSTQGGVVQFDETLLNIRTAQLNCGNKGINRDLQATLKVKEYPFIEIRLHRVYLAERPIAIGSAWAEMTALTEITLAGTSQMVEMPFQARRVDGDIFQFKSFHTLTLTSFNIDPPTVLMGLIKVNDEITIYFDLHIKTNTEELN